MYVEEKRISTTNHEVLFCIFQVIYSVDQWRIFVSARKCSLVPAAKSAELKGQEGSTVILSEERYCTNMNLTPTATATSDEVVHFGGTITISF